MWKIHFKSDEFTHFPKCGNRIENNVNSGVETTALHYNIFSVYAQ